MPLNRKQGKNRRCRNPSDSRVIMIAVVSGVSTYAAGRRGWPGCSLHQLPAPESSLDCKHLLPEPHHRACAALLATLLGDDVGNGR